MLPPTDDDASELLALLQSGEPWSTSGLAAALGKSQRSVQRALSSLQGDGRVTALGRGRTQRWVVAPQTAFATTLLLVARGTLG
jgi:biotin operon repressor